MLPEAVRLGYMRLARYLICACGLASDTVGDVEIDGRIAVVQPHPDSSLYLCPLGSRPHPTYTEALFYSDCISYENETPSVVYPTRKEISSFPFLYAYNGPSKPKAIMQTDFPSGRQTKYLRKPIDPRKLVMQTYVDSVINVLELTRELKHGPLTYILFRTFGRQDKVDLKYSVTYGRVAKELSLYSSALKQPDLLSEYLSYYRIIEAVSQSNGKDWVEYHLDRLSTHQFGQVAIRHDFDEYQDPPKNLLSIYKRRALIRYRQLRGRLGGNRAIAKYLYGVNRCGIAHGKGSILKAEMLPSYFEVGKDALILKMLSRIAIDAMST